MTEEEMFRDICQKLMGIQNSYVLMQEEVLNIQSGMQDLEMRFVEVMSTIDAAPADWVEERIRALEDELKTTKARVMELMVKE